MKQNQPRFIFRPAFLFAATLAALAAALAWTIPAQRDEAALGRLSYSGFWLAVALSAMSLTFALLSVARQTRRVLLAWIGAIAAILLAETLAWFLPLRHPMDNPWYLSGESAAAATTNLPFTRPPHIKWRGTSRGDLAMLNNSADPYARTILFQTDFEGFNNSSDKTQADLLFLGDSFTEAGNIPESETFAALVAERQKLTWRNLGRAGYSTPSELEVLKQYGLPCKPRLVIWQIAEPNDLDEAVAFEKWQNDGRPNYFSATKTSDRKLDAWRKRSPTYRIFAALRSPESMAWSFRGQFRDATGKEHDIWFLLDSGLEFSAVGHPGRPAFATALAQGAELCKANQIRMLVVLIPSKFRVMGAFVGMQPDVAAQAALLPGLPEEHSLAAFLSPLCEKLNIPFIDATKKLAEQTAAGALVYLPRDTHLSPKGHEITADLIEKHLAAINIPQPDAKK